jgi:hypothetical protein
MSLEVLYEIAGRDDHRWAAERAAMVIAINEQYQGGGLDYSEYQELLKDLVRMDKLDAEATDLELKTALVSAVYAVAQVV